MAAIETPEKTPKGRMLVAAGVCIAFGGLAVALAIWKPGFPDQHSQALDRPGTTVEVPDEVEKAVLDTELMDIPPQDAVLLNEERPNDLTAPPPARPFVVDAVHRDSKQYAAALECLAQAVYYEAGYESEVGKRAVAQVVLNRVRHPTFPSTVCGVVYQGSTRSTGCQFTFTCDGSLRRVPPKGAFASAMRVAREALAGKVVADIGYATHYHANYVVPYWAPSLAKTGRIGTHIFYNMRGVPGTPRAFSMRHQLFSETLAGLDTDPEEELVASEEDESPNIVALPIEAWEDRPVFGTRPRLESDRSTRGSALKVDENLAGPAADDAGSLLLDERNKGSLGSPIDR